MPGFPRLRDAYDFVVVGGGHAGLQATLKAALFAHSVALVDRGPKYSRSFYAPRLANIPGFPEEISGHKLLDLQVAALRHHEERVGYFTPARATAARAVEGGFELSFDWLGRPQATRGRALVLAMGVVDKIPEVAGQIKTIFPWANQGIVDFCLFCDGHELAGRSVAVIGSDAFAARTALDVLHWGPTSVTLLTNGHTPLEGLPTDEAAQLRGELDRASIPVFTEAMTALGGIRDKRLEVTFSDGDVRTYDRGFSALGWWEMNQGIPRSLGAAFDGDGYVVTDEDCRVLAAADRQVIPGLYCIGDQRNGWNQIPEAWATAERAVIHAYASYL